MARTRRKFSQEFKAEIVALARQGCKPVAELARTHEISDSALHNWLRQTRIDAGDGPAGALTTQERQELTALRREIRQLRDERDFLKKTSAWFARYAR